MKICILGNANSPHLKTWLAMYEGFTDVTFYILTLNKQEYHPFQAENIKYIYVSKKYGLLFSLISIKNILGKIKPTILHCHSAGSYGVISYLLRFKPLIITTYGSEIYDCANKGWMYTYIMKKILKNAQKVTCTSENMKEYLIDNLDITSNKVYQFSLGVDHEKFINLPKEQKESIYQKYRLDSEETVFISNRRILPLYHITEIIEAFALLNKAKPDTKLIVIKGDVADDNPYYLQVKDKIEQLGISHQIRLIEEFLTAEELMEVYNISTFFISIPDTDQLSTSILEGMSCGCLPILHDITPYNRLKRDTKAFFIQNNKDIAEIYGQLLYCYDQKKTNELKAFIEVNQEYISINTSYQSAIENTKKLYRGFD